MSEPSPAAAKEKPRWDRILLKVSGEAFAGTDSYGIDGDTVQAIANNLSLIHI